MTILPPPHPGLLKQNLWSRGSGSALASSAEILQHGKGEQYYSEGLRRGHGSGPASVILTAMC